MERLYFLAEELLVVHDVLWRKSHFSSEYMPVSCPCSAGCLYMHVHSGSTDWTHRENDGEREKYLRVVGGEICVGHKKLSMTKLKIF